MHDAKAARAQHYVDDGQTAGWVSEATPDLGEAVKVSEEDTLLTLYLHHTMQWYTTGTLPNIRNTLNKKSTRHSGLRIAANSYE